MLAIVERQIDARCRKKFVESCWKSFLEKRERLIRHLRLYLRLRHHQTARISAKKVLKELRELTWETYKNERLSQIKSENDCYGYDTSR